MATGERELDIVVWGATGFTGELTAEYLLERYGVDTGPRWALGGRNRAKLEAVRERLAKDVDPRAAELALVEGESTDPASMAALAARTRVVCTTVGPYAKYGSELVAACAAAGTHYCDLTGEVHWMRRMIDAHHAEAAANGARIVHTCGFDCIPSDLGTLFVQQTMLGRHGVPARRVKYRVAGFSGGASGGTIASGLNMMEEAARDPEVRRVMNDPYGLNPEGLRSGPDGPDSMTPSYDDDFEQWTAPFVMAAVDTRVVRRSAALLAGRYGDDFRYDEATLTGSGPVGFLKAAGVAAGLAGGMGAMALGPVRRLVAPRLPQPGDGPSREVQEAGYWDVHMLGEHPTDSGKNVRVRVRGDRDPGYGSTSRMLGESAVCLAEDALDTPCGVLTPAVAMGDPLIRRLERSAGLSFAIED